MVKLTKVDGMFKVAKINLERNEDIAFAKDETDGKTFP